MKEYEYTGKAMGTVFSISIICKSQNLAQKLREEAISEIQNYECIFSRFSPNSELSRLNKDKIISASNTFILAVLKARELFSKTKGIFNPLVQIERLGYNKDYSQIKDTQTVAAVEEYNLDFESVIINEEESKVILKENQKLDFGGFLKGYLAEIICKRIKESSDEIFGVIVNLGGDIYTLGKDAQNENFVFSIYNPITEKDDISVNIYNGTLATSGTYKRSWVRNYEKVHHILDISGSKNPESDTISASVIHKDGGKAEAYAKVLLSLKPEEAKEILEGEILQFIVIQKDGTIVKNTQ